MIVLTLVDAGVALLVKGSTCVSMMAPLLLLATTGIQVKENHFGSSSISGFLLADLMIILLSVADYATAEIIVNLSVTKLYAFFSRLYRACLARYQTNFFNRNNQILPHNVHAINNFAEPELPLTPFKKMMILIKGMGFLAGFVFLFTIVFTLKGNLSFFIVIAIRTGFKLILQCMPVYWVLLIDDVYELTKRRVTPFLTLVHDTRHRKITPFIPRSNGLKPEYDVPNAGPSTAAREVNGPIGQKAAGKFHQGGDIPIAGASTSAAGSEVNGSFRHHATDSKHREPQQEGDLPIAGTSTPASADREVNGSFRHRTTDSKHGEPQQEGDLPIAVRSTSASVAREGNGPFRHQTIDSKHGEPQQEGDLPIAVKSISASVDREVNGSFRHQTTYSKHIEP